MGQCGRSVAEISASMFLLVFLDTFTSYFFRIVVIDCDHKPARAHGLPKTHKTFDILPPFRPVVDSTGTAYQPVAKYLSQLLNPLASNEFSLKDSFDAVNRIKNIPQHLFDRKVTVSYRLTLFRYLTTFL